MIEDRSSRKDIAKGRMLAWPLERLARQAPPGEEAVGKMNAIRSLRGNNHETPATIKSYSAIFFQQREGSWRASRRILGARDGENQDCLPHQKC